MTVFVCHECGSDMGCVIKSDVIDDDSFKIHCFNDIEVDAIFKKVK